MLSQSKSLARENRSQPRLTCPVFPSFRGIIKATKELHLEIPLIVRLQGTKEHEAKKWVLIAWEWTAQCVLKERVPVTRRLIKDSGLAIFPFDGLDEGVWSRFRFVLVSIR